MASNRLTDEEVDQAVDWINGKAISPTDACPVCGSPDNNVIDAMIRLALGPTPKGSQRSMPMVLTVCMNCGFTRQFNAIVMGLRKAGPTESEQQPAESDDGAAAA